MSKKWAGGGDTRKNYYFHGMSTASFEIGLEEIVAIPSKTVRPETRGSLPLHPCSSFCIYTGLMAAEIDLQPGPRHARDKGKIPSSFSHLYFRQWEE